MNRIDSLSGRETILAAAFMGGDPGLAYTEDYILSLAESNVRLLEIGIPFSDPAAESPGVQAAHQRALDGGAGLLDILGLLGRLRQRIPQPLILRSYLNPLLALGYPLFFDNCKKAGLDGLAISDLPFEERGELLPLAQEAGIHLITTLAPAPPEKLARMMGESTGLLYLLLPEDEKEAAEMEALVREQSSLPLVKTGGSGSLPLGEVLAGLIAKDRDQAATAMAACIRALS